MLDVFRTGERSIRQRDWVNGSSVILFEVCCEDINDPRYLVISIYISPSSSGL